MLNLQDIHFEKKNMKIFITGGAGYCGSRLTRQLLDHGHSVTVYDACYFGTAGLPLDDSKLKLIKGDIRDVDLLKKGPKLKLPMSPNRGISFG